ncbi:hypothetical protein [Methanoplanus limicola]|uniref:Antitoxin n=1 Tax=Methanoplanus limicola DSM 2279 TaxID=937775 RepID=H1YYN2_9EURY|nr:hypothetical protein [Methanoplanus limicola]EHQ36015.1 hypothetical protein Metlim_1921 [Methanoplanus limicola DSM 2279]
MTTKAVNLSKEAYDRLNKLKLNEEESFSSVILRTTPRFKSSDEAIETYEKKRKESQPELSLQNCRDEAIETYEKKRKGNCISDEEAERILGPRGK